MAKKTVNVKLMSAARKWIGTPYALSQREKGVGTDCVNFFAGIAEDAAYVNPGVIPVYTVPAEFWLSDPTFIEDKLADAETYLGLNLGFSVVDLSVLTRSLWWMGETILPGDLILLGTKDLPTVASHAVLADVVQSDLMRFIHAWNPTGGGGDVRYGILGKYFVPLKRYRLQDKDTIGPVLE